MSFDKPSEDAEKRLYDEDIKAIKRLTLSAKERKEFLEIAERRYKQTLENLAKHHG